MSIEKLKIEISGEVYMMVNHDDDRELADEIVNEIMKLISVDRD